MICLNLLCLAQALHPTRHGPHSQPPPKTPPPSPGQLPDPRYHLAPRLVPSPLWGWGISGAIRPVSPSNFQQIHCVPCFFQQFFSSQMEVSMGKPSIYRANEVSPPTPARIAPSTSLHWLRRRAWSEPTTIPRPLAGDPCHRRCPFTCPRKSCRLGKMRCQYQTNHLRSNTFEKYPWIK